MNDKEKLDALPEEEIRKRCRLGRTIDYRLDYLFKGYMIFKRLCLVCLIISLLMSVGWATKYEYVRLVLSKDSTPKATYSFGRQTLSAYDSIVLYSGDSAKVIGSTPVGNLPNIWFNDGNLTFFYGNAGIFSNHHGQNTIVGPGIVFITPFSSLPSETNSGYSITLAIERASESGSTTLAWNDTEWTNPNSSTQIANNSSSGSVQYDTLLGWCYFTDTPWLYSYTNGSWYYMQSINNEVYVWNANLPDGGWTKLRG